MLQLIMAMSGWDKLLHEIEMNGIYHHLLCLMQCCMNGAVFHKVHQFVAPIHSETMYAIQIFNLFDGTYYTSKYKWSH